MPDSPLNLGVLNIDSLTQAIQLVADNYQSFSNSADFGQSLDPIWDWVYTNIEPGNERRRFETDLANYGNSTKEEKTERILQALALLRVKFFTEQKKINIASIQEVMAEWEAAETQLADRGNPTTKLTARFKKISAIRAVQYSTASIPEKEIPSTPSQLDPRLTTNLAEVFREIPQDQYQKFHEKISILTQKAAEASSEDYPKVVSEILTHIEKTTGKRLPESLRRDILNFIPPPAPFSDPVIKQNLEKLDTVEAKAEYLQKNTAHHLHKDQVLEISRQYDQNPIPVVSKVVDVIREHSYIENLSTTQSSKLLQDILPETLKVHSAETVANLQKKISLNTSGDSSFIEDLIFSKQFTEKASLIKNIAPNPLDNLIAAINPKREASLESDSMIIAFRSGVPAEVVSNLLIDAHSTTLSYLPTPEYALKFTNYIGLINPNLSLTDPKNEQRQAIANSVLEVLTDQKFQSTKPHVIKFLTEIPKGSTNYVQKTTLDRVQGEFSTLIASTFPAGSPEALILTKFIDPLTRGFSASPLSAQQTLTSTVNLLNFLSPQANTNLTLNKLLPLVETLKSVHPEIKLFASSTSAILQSHTSLTANSLNTLTNQLTIRYLNNPFEKPGEFEAYFTRTIVPHLETLSTKALSATKRDQILSDLKTNLLTNHLKLSPDNQIISSLTSSFITSGLTPSQARVLAPKLLDAAKISFASSGFAAQGRTFEETRAFQQAAFKNMFGVTLASLTDKHPELGRIDFSKLGADKMFNDLHNALGRPNALSPAFLVQLKSPVLFSLTQYLSSYIPEPVRPLVTNMAKVMVGKTFLNTPFAKESGLKSMLEVLASGPTKFRPLGMFSRFDIKNPERSWKVLQRLTNMQVAKNPIALAFKTKIQQPISNSVQMVWSKTGSALWGKLAASKAGQALAQTALGATIKGLAVSLGSAAPVIGNLIALAVSWAVGEIITRLIDPTLRFLKTIKDNVIPAAVTILLGLGANLAGVAILPSALLGITGGLLTGGIQSAISGKTFGFSSETAANAASKINYVATSIATASVTSSFSAVIVGVIAIPVVVAFFLYIINASALVTPPTVYNVGDGVGFQNNSSCPLASGRITSWSYDTARQEAQGSGNRAHGANGYWRDVWGNNTQRYCSFHLPADGVTCAPTEGPTNYCFIRPNCGVGNQRNPFYGYAIDVTSSDRTVSLPQVNGQSANWTYGGNPFCDADTGCAHVFTSNGPDGNTYSLLFLHLEADVRGPQPNTTPAPGTTGYVSGFPFGRLYDQGGNTHLHLEVQINGEYVKPENYFCGSGVPSPTGSVVPPLDSNCSAEATGDPVTFGRVQTLPSTSRTGYCIIPRYIVMHWSGAWNGVQGTFNTFAANSNSCQLATDHNNTLQMLDFWQNRVEMAKNCANQHNTDSISVEMSGSCFSLMPGFSFCDEPSEVTPPPESETARTVDLVCRLKEQYNISINNIIGHYEFISTKADPGAEYLQEVFLPRVMAQCP